MRNPTRPFDRYRTRSALFLMIYATTALIAGVPNITLVTIPEEKRIFVILAASILVVSRYVGYIKLAGFALLSSEHIKKNSTSISLTIGIIVIVLISNAAYFLYCFGFTDISVMAVSAGCLGTAGVLISHLIGSLDRGITRSRLMRMVSGVLIALGCADICITRFWISPIIGLITLLFGIYTERKSLSLAMKQTFAVASGSAGAGIAIYFLRWYLDPTLIRSTMPQPPIAIGFGLIIALLGIAYYIYSRRLYATETAISPTE